MSANFTARVLILFAVVGSVAFVMPLNPEAADSHTVNQAWGNLPLNAALKAGQHTK